MRDPSVFVLGAQKCGTTTVADLLAEQPEVFVPSIKETYFFCDPARFELGTDWYRSEFYAVKAFGAAKLLCDATPFYLASSCAIDRLANFNPGSGRYIVCLRDPVDRAYSAYWHQQRLGNETLDFEQALASESERVSLARERGQRWWRHAYVEVGMFGSQLRYAFERLGRENFLILTSEDLRDIAEVQIRIRAFLGLPRREGLPSSKRSNASGRPRSRFLQDAVNRPSIAKRFIRKVVPRELRSSIGRNLLELNLKPFRYPPMNERTRGELRSRFKSDLYELQAHGVMVPQSWFSGSQHG
ncbi:sulfotransferase family protein [Rhodopirellula europaea]|uniref:Sulfotransferase n=1 Tax=Rhodopirellula europaea 6C TaxID=1263867 RepID=M2A5R6_9BACT|nr:sulfotransferase [Rhodopirellula europaea]EMB15681.1 sulfotransferase [Rhodopirellula europaea 6C]